FSGRLDLGSNSSLAALFVLGLLAGFSTCAALVGGIVLSLSKSWAVVGTSPWRAPAAFNAGRLASFTLLGAVLGAIGSQVRVSPLVTAAMAIAVSLAMFVAALGMLGVRLPLPEIRLPRSIGRVVAGGSAAPNRAPFIVGALTFLLPCGFTFTAQGLAVLSGDALSGGLTMLAFALGTLPGLLLIGFTGTRLWGDRARSALFSRVAAIMVLFFALYTVNSQLNVLGLPSLSDIGRQPVAAAAAVPTPQRSALAGILPTVQATVYPAGQTVVTPAGDLAPIEDGVQVLRMDASASGYRPNSFRVRTGVPVRWEITDKGTSGCTNAVIARALFDGVVELRPGQTSIIEFTPAKAGRYKFSCWMGMVSGVIEVVDVP
ncbi:MAG: urease accessory protein UreH domain-containing protein, partial [Anaerolineae bacterium]